MKVLLFNILAFLTLGPLFAQTECHMYHRKNCDDGEGAIMKYDSQSKSAVIGKGQTSEFHLVAYHDLDYRVIVCSEENLGDKVQFKIYEKKKVYDHEDEGSAESGEEYVEEGSGEASAASNASNHKMVKELLYDNATDSYSNKIEFTAENTMSLLIEVTVPGDGNTSKLKIRETGCVGVLISHMKSKTTGF